MNCLCGSAYTGRRAGGLVAAWFATGNEKYRDALISVFDYVYGCNSLGRSWIAGFSIVFHVKHLDSWLPRYLRQNDLWTSRPGISMYYMGHNEQPDYKIRKGFVGLQFDGRGDQQCPAINCNTFFGYGKTVNMWYSI